MNFCSQLRLCFATPSRPERYFLKFFHLDGVPNRGWGAVYHPVPFVWAFIFFLLVNLVLPAFSQDDPFTTVSSPSGRITAVSESTGLFTHASSPDALPSAQSVPPVTKPSSLKKEPIEQWEHELLRDPFWPVGFFPEGWAQKSSSPDGSSQDKSDWKTAFGKIQISGTSKLGGRAGAIINGELKSVGDQIDILHAGRMYQWQIVGIDVNGQVQLKKLGIK